MAGPITPKLASSKLGFYIGTFAGQISAALLCRAWCRDLIRKHWQPHKTPRERKHATTLMKPSNTHKQTHLPGEARVTLSHIDSANLDDCDSFVGVFGI